MSFAKSVYGKYIEVITGLVTLVILACVCIWVFDGARVANDKMYSLKAVFTHIDGLDKGSDVRVGGVNIGKVTSVSMDPNTWQAVVSFDVEKTLKLPVDSSAVITSDSLLGGKYVSLNPGGDSTLLKSGDLMSDTQGSISLESLLSKFIFSVSDSLHRACIQPESSAAPSEPNK